MAQPLVELDARVAGDEHVARLARLVRTQFGFVWRLLRRVGVTDTEAASAVEQVFGAAAQRIGDIRNGSERAFLFSSSLHVAARVQRERVPEAALSDGAPTLEDLDAAQQSREILGVLLQQMPLELRVVFILHEIEQLPSAQIAEIIGIPPSTVTSRLSEALDDFATHLEAGSDLADSLLRAARQETPPEGALERSLRSFGARVAVTEANAGAVSVRQPVSASVAPVSVENSPLAIAAKWLAMGLVIGLLATSAVYALSDALLAPHTAAAR